MTSVPPAPGARGVPTTADVPPVAAAPAQPAAGARRQARERALSLLYEADSKEVGAETILAGLPVEPAAFTVELVSGVASFGEEIDGLLGRFARGWAVERMPAIDRTLLRIGVFELVHRPDVPTAVAISEAVDLAHRYSTDDSGRFVNGVLAAVAVEVRPDLR